MTLEQLLSTGYTGPTWEDIAAMWHDGIKGNAEAAEKSLRAALSGTYTPPVAATPAPAPTPTGPTWAAKLASARAQAEANAELYLRSQGYNPAQYMPLIMSHLDRIQGGLVEGDDLKTAFPSTIASDIMTGELASARNSILGQVNAKFTPGYEKTALPNSLLDDIIADILGTQQTSAMDYLNRGKARGIINDVGYNAGLASIGSGASAGRSDLSSLATTVLDRYRSELDTVGDAAFNAASSWTLGSPAFSLEPYINDYNSIIANANANAGGDLRNLLGGKNYFDFSDLMNSAGKAQGALNLRDTDVATALRERQRRNTLSRGLGSQGAF